MERTKMLKTILPSISFLGTLRVEPVPVSAQRGHPSNPAGGGLKGFGTGGDSLGKSVQPLDPKANSTTETKEAQKQANDDLNESVT
jgi:hypothetical protein